MKGHTRGMDKYNYTDKEWKILLSTALESLCKGVIEYFKSNDKEFTMTWEELYSEYILAAINKNLAMMPQNGRNDN